MFPPEPIDDLSWNEMTEDKLAAHGLDVGDALNVFDSSPRYFDQPPVPEVDRSGRRRMRPRRILMVGPAPGRPLLTFVLEYPDASGAAHVVSGWPANRDQRARYNQAR